MKTCSAMFSWAMVFETSPWYQWRWGEQKNTQIFDHRPLWDNMQIIFNPRYPSRIFTAWFMLRPYVWVLLERRFAVGLETEGRWALLSAEDAGGGKIQIWLNISPFSLCLMGNHQIGRNLVHCEYIPWGTGFGGYKLYPRALKIWRPHG